MSRGDRTTVNFGPDIAARRSKASACLITSGPSCFSITIDSSKQFGTLKRTVAESWISRVKAGASGSP
jgi:hypothetical protein